MRQAKNWKGIIMSKVFTLFFIFGMISVPVMILCKILEIEIALSFLTSLIASYIAYQQYLTSKSKLNLDLYEKRYKVYNATRTFLSTILSRQTYTQEDYNDFFVTTSDSEILFGQKTSNYLKEIRTKAQNMSIAKEEMKNCDFDTEERKSYMLEEQKHRYWLDDQILEGKMNDIFKPHFDFSNIKSDL